MNRNDLNKGKRLLERNSNKKEDPVDTIYKIVTEGISKIWNPFTKKYEDT